MSLYKHILVAIDGSPTSDKALDEGIRLARSDGASLLLLHVVDELDYVRGFESAMIYVNEIVPLMRETGEKLLVRARQKALEQGVTAGSVLLAGGAGRVSEHVNEQVRLAGAELIVIGSHGRRGMDRVLLGSDAEQIVRHARLPVLIVRV